MESYNNNKNYDNDDDYHHYEDNHLDSDTIQMQIPVIVEYANTPELQSYMNKQVYHQQAVSVIKQLCAVKAIIKVNQVGTTQCLFCNSPNDQNSQKILTHFCQNSFHAKCIREKFEEINPQFQDNVYLNCPQCAMEFFQENIQEAYGGAQVYQNKKQACNTQKCYICDSICISNTYLTHFCDKPIHHDCLQKIIIKQNKSLDPSVLISCKECQMEFMIEQIWEAFGGKQKYQELRNKLDDQFVQQMELDMKKQRSKEARERNFECEICMGEGNINDDCRTLDHCMHQFCQDCLRDHIRNSKNAGKIECPLCSELPPNERKFPDPNHPVGYVHDPLNIEIQLPIIKDLLPKEEFLVLEELWTRKFYKTGNDKIVLLSCPGFIKKAANQEQRQIELIIEQKVHEKMLQGNLKNLGFEFINCTAMYELDLDQDINKYRCKACELEFCPKCKDQGHEGTCEEYKKWKLENEKSDEALEELLKKEPKTYKKCPKCKALIMKASGCNRVPCANKKCGAHICWVCMEFFPDSKTGYAHIDKAHPGKLWKE